MSDDDLNNYIANDVPSDLTDELTSRSQVDMVKTSEAIKTGLLESKTPTDEFKVANTHRLCGGIFSGSTPDTNFYQTTLTGSATTTITDRLLAVSTGTTANSTARIETVTTGQYTSSNANFARLIIQLGDIGATNNIRRWGATTTTNGFFFYLNGTEFGVGYRKNGVETLIPQSSFNGDKSFVMDINLHSYEIYFKTSIVYYTVDGVQVHEIKPTTTLLSADYNLKPAITNVNSNGSTTNHTINCSAMTLSRLGELTTNPIYKNLVGAGTTTLKQSAGRLHSIVCNNAAASTGQSIAVYDNIAGSGTKIGTIDLSKLPSPMVMQYNASGVAFSTGLTLVIVGSAVDITVIYE